MDIVEIEKYSDDVLYALNSLLPQLSSTFVTLRKCDLELIIFSKEITLLMANDNGVFKGTLSLLILPIPSGTRAVIDDVVVCQSSRGQGIGAKLVDHAIEIACGLRVKSIDLTSRSSRKAAVSLYTKKGFRIRKTNAYRYICT